MTDQKTSVVALVGAGQLGSRYVQGLSGCKQPLEVHVVDPSPEAIAVCMDRWNQAGPRSHHAIHPGASTEGLPAALDLVIVATSARERCKVVTDVAGRCEVGYWILEKVLAQSVEDLEAIEACVAPSKAAWINLPRRAMKWHQRLCEQFARDTPLKASLTGSNWGLACNSIHFLDLISWWTGEALLSIDTSRLDDQWIESKRKGYREVLGELVANFAGGSSLHLVAGADSSELVLTVETASGEFWRLDEASGNATNQHGAAINGGMEAQSILSGPLVDRILETGTCDLPRVVESLQLHSCFLEELLKHWNRVHTLADTAVPIT